MTSVSRAISHIDPWDEFRSGLAAVIHTWNPDAEEVLIISVRDLGGGDSGRYAQFAPVDNDGTVRAEIVGDEFVAPEHKMRAEAADRLLVAGWAGNSRTAANWFRKAPVGDLEDLNVSVESVIWVLRHEFGAETPDHLRFKAWGETLDGAKAGRLPGSAASLSPEGLTSLKALLSRYLGCNRPLVIAEVVDPPLESDRAVGPTRPALPRPRLVKTAAAAEDYAAEVMAALGFGNARSTPAGADGGVDVVSDEGLAQVKMEGLPTGRPVIQAIYGLASLAKKQTLVFSLAGYSPQAREWAEHAHVALFEFEFDGTICGQSSYAAELLECGYERRPFLAEQLDATVVAPVAGDPPAIVERLRALGDLYREGLLTIEEFEAAKTKLLS